MKKEIQAKLAEIVTLLNDSEETVIEKEVKEKLEVIIGLIDNPNDIQLDKAQIQEKLEKVISLVNNANVDPDIDIEYSTPDESGDTYVMVTYVVGDYNKPTRKIHLRETALRRTSVEDLANQVTFSIEEFKGEIDSVNMG